MTPKELIDELFGPLNAVLRKYADQPWTQDVVEKIQAELEAELHAFAEIWEVSILKDTTVRFLSDQGVVEIRNQDYVIGRLVAGNRLPTAREYLGDAHCQTEKEEP